MEIFLIIILLAVTTIFCMVDLKSDDRLKTLETQMLKNEIRILQDKVRKLEYENNILKNYKSFFETSYKTATYIYDNDIKEAVKYAMKKSHPDNGGSSDDFNKFRELYNKIK